MSSTASALTSQSGSSFEVGMSDSVLTGRPEKAMIRLLVFTLLAACIRANPPIQLNVTRPQDSDLANVHLTFAKHLATLVAYTYGSFEAVNRGWIPLRYLV